MFGGEIPCVRKTHSLHKLASCFILSPIKEEMYLPVYVYNCVAEKKKSILSLYIWQPNSLQQPFYWANRLMPRAQGWRHLCCAGNQEEPQAELAVGLA